MVESTFTPRGELSLLPSKQALCKAFVGKPLTSLRTPCAIIDVAKVRNNCARMHKISQQWGALFRAHIKTHKTAEGTFCQLRSTEGSTNAIIVSTLMEAWGILDSGLVEQGVVDDILYGLPVGVNKIHDLFSIRSEIRKRSPSGDRAQIRLMIDHPKQVEAVEKAAKEAGEQPWSCFVKIETGGKRAGLEPNSPLLKALLETVNSSPHISIHGFYGHAGQSYASKSISEADEFLTTEVKCVNEAASFANSILETNSRHSNPFILSVGSTPTAHAANLQPSSEILKKLNENLNGKLELHAGNYPFLDLQQISTNSIPTDKEEKSTYAMKDVSLSVLSTVIAEYPKRGSEEEQAGQWSTDGLSRDGDEAMCDSGGLAMSKDSGPLGGFGHIIDPPEKRGWELGRVAQEHGVLTIRKGGPENWVKTWGLEEEGTKRSYPAQMKIGETIRIVGQHACMIAAAHRYFYVVDSSKVGGDLVSDVWVPWKGW